MASRVPNTKMRRKRVLSLEPLEARAMLSITATIDYSFDTNNFFNSNAKKDLLQLAADNIVAYFQDDLAAITPSGGNNWSAYFFHPGNGSSQSVSNLNVAADEIIIYAGGRNLGGSLGQGGPGGYSVGGSSSWITTVQTRGETGVGNTDFGPWGGSVTFNSTSNWHFGETTSGLSGGEYDFYSVALHELCHLFGFGTADSFDTYVNTGADAFSGPESVAQYDGTGNVPLTSSNGHWASGTTDGAQEAAMDPSLTSGTRKELTLLDLAGLSDLGWELDLSEAAQTKLFAADLAQSDWFGYSVDIDGNYAVVGAPASDDNGGESGSAYVYFFENGNWVEQAKITASNAGAVDEFGWSVAIDGDTVVVGSWLEDTNGNNAGAAYVFQRDHGGTDNWGQVAMIAGSDTTTADKFGFSVDIAGDTIVVGAEHDDPSGSASGAAYVFQRDHGGTNNWGEVAKLTGSDSGASDLFGYSVSIDGDFAVVGSVFGDAAVVNAGSAYLFGRNVGGTNNWGQVKKLTAADAAASDQFGFSVSVSGTTIAVGARLDDDGGKSTGSVYVYDIDEGGTNNWGQVTKITAADLTVGGRFGHSVALDGDDLAVGEYQAVITTSNGDRVSVGAAYHYARDQGGTGSWGMVERLIADDAANKDRNGISVGISNNRVLSGAYFEDPNGITSAGSTYVYLINPGGSGGSGGGLLPEQEPLFGDNRLLSSRISNQPSERMSQALADNGFIDSAIEELSQDLPRKRFQSKELFPSDSPAGDDNQEAASDWLAANNLLHDLS